MSFRTEANKVRAGIARGDFKKKRDYFASFVDPLVSGLETQAAAKMQEDLDKRREDRAAARELKKTQDAKELQDKKNDALADAFMLSQGASGPVAKSQIVALINAGYDDPAKLTEFFEKNAKFNPDVITNQVAPPTSMQIDSVNNQMSTLGLGPLPDGQASEISRELDGETKGAFEFGKQPEPYDLGKLREENWEGERAQAVNDQRPDVVSDIDAWAKSRGLIKVVGQLTQKDINGKTLADLRKLKMQYGAVPEIDAAIVIEEAIEIDQQPWNNPAELALLDLNTLQAYKAGSFKLGKEAQGNIDSAIQLRIAIDKSSNLAQASQQLDKDSSYYDAALAKLGPVDANSPTAAQDLETFKTLTKLSSLAKENEKDAKFQSERSKSAKELALDAYLNENGFFIPDAANGVIKYPGSGDMAEFEKSWKELTDISEKPPEWFEKDENLLKLTTTQMKALLDTGLLPEAAQNKVQGFYNSMQDTSVIERMISTDFNSTTDIDQFIATQGIDTLKELDEESYKALLAQRRVLLDKENEEQTDYNAYQEAAAIFFTDNPKTYENILKFEREYKAGTAVPKDTFQSRTLFNSTGGSVTVESLEEQRDAETKGYSIYKPSEIDVQLTNLGLADTEDNRRIIAGVKNGTYKLSKDFAGRTTIVDLTTQTSEGVKGTPIPIEQVVGQDGELQITVTQDQIDQAAAFKNDLDKIPEDVEEGMAGAVGIRGVINRVVGKVSDAGGWKAKQDNLAAMNFVTNLRVYTMVTLAAAQGTRDSVWQKQQILSTLPETARFWQGPMETGNKVRDTLAAISNSISILETNRDSGMVTGSDLSKITQQLTQLGELQKVYTELDAIFQDINGTAQKKNTKITDTDFFQKSEDTE